MKKTIGCLLALALSGAIASTVAVPAFTRVSADGGQAPPPSNVFVSEYDQRSALAQAAADLESEIVGEGAVMLKNDDNALPLKDGAKISVFGKNATRYKYFKNLRSGGFDVNKTLQDFYNDDTKSGTGAGVSPTNGQVSPGYNTGETPIKNYTQDIKDSFKEYSDAAVVVIYRAAGEGWDDPRSMRWDGNSYGAWTGDSTQTVPGARNGDDHYLQLDQNETDLIKMCGDNFDKVIVLFHVSSSFETGFLDDPGHYAYHNNVKAAFFLGYPTNVSFVAKLLKGEINPSGHTTDTWARDFKLDPTWQNFGNYLMEAYRAEDDSTDEGITEAEKKEKERKYKGNQYTNLSGSDGLGGGGYANNYVTYNEGIYVGYRYWETRDFTEGKSAYASATEAEKAQYLDNFRCDALPNGSGGSAGKSKDYIHGTTTTSWDSWYDAHVVYPFGHGLSYTTFTQTLVSSEPTGNAKLSADGTITLKVKVKNTGAVAGKDVVQVYYTAPYKAGEVEKSQVVLAAFEKTKLLEPNEEQTLTVTFKVRDMASYDYSDANKNNFKGYELDAGDYVVRLMKNSHETIETVTYVLENDVKYETSETTENPIENRFDEVSDYITDDLGQKYLSRNDWEGTWPKFNYRLTASEAVLKSLHEWWIEGGAQTRDPKLDEQHPYYTTTMPTTGAKNGIVLKDLRGLDYDDPKWDDYLDQFTVAQLKELATRGAYASGQNYPELGVKRMANYDFPGGFVIFGGAADAHYSFSAAITLASTWNKDIAYRYGKIIGEDALWGWNDRIGGWYAPAVNIHRSPFAGRNWEYYSEDGYLAGKIAANIAKGAQEKGLLVYIKHFAVNNSETNRCGVMTWLNEQAMREIYFRPFELSVKEGKALGIMTALNRIGAIWAGGSHALLTEVLRDEWGFKGSVVTDAFMGDASNLSNADQMIRAGGNFSLGTSTLFYNPDSATTISILREMAHGSLYAQVQTNALNEIPQGQYYPIDSFSGGMAERGIVGLPYNQSLAKAKISRVLYPNADDSEIVYTLNAESKLPAGLTLSEKGLLSGTPTESCNNYRFKVDATYAGYTRTAEFTISIVGSNGAIVYEAEENLGTIYVNKAANLTVAGAQVVNPNATSPLPACTYSLAGGSKLPAGLTLNPDGTITGTPTAVVENAKFSVTANANGYTGVTLEFRLNIFYEMTFTGSTLANGKLGVSYMQKLPAATTQGQVTYTVDEESRLPNGLTLTSGGTITGTPKETVTDYTVIIVASAPYTTPVKAEFKLTIGLAFNDIQLANGKVGESYQSRVDTAQGAGEIVYTLKEGSTLPDGLNLSESGVLSGTPTKAGDYTFTIVATADGKLGDEITLTLHINEGTAPKGEADNGCGSIIGIGGASVFIAAICLSGGILVTTKHSRKKEDTAHGEEKQN